MTEAADAATLTPGTIPGVVPRIAGNYVTGADASLTSCPKTSRWWCSSPAMGSVWWMAAIAWKPHSGSGEAFVKAQVRRESREDALRFSVDLAAAERGAPKTKRSMPSSAGAGAGARSRTP